MGDRYVRCIALADHDGCGAAAGASSIIDYHLGLEFLRQIAGPMILLCGCRDSRHGHRAAVARRLWLEHRWDSRELDWDDESAFPPHSEASYTRLCRGELAHRA